MRSFIVVSLLLLAYAITRAPFLTQPLIGEEGIFAHLMAASPTGPNYGLMGRVGGKAICAPLDHPGLMYAVYSRLGAMMRMAAGADFKPTDIWARLVHSLFQALLLGLLAWRAARAQGLSALVLFALAVVALSAPLGLSASVHLQTDTSSGLLLAGLVAWALVEAEPNAWKLPSTACAVLSATGKQEWAIAAGLGLVGSEVINSVWLGRDRASQRFLLACLGGLAIGQLISWAFDPLNYIGGWKVLLHLGGSHVVGISQPLDLRLGLAMRLVFWPALLLGLALSLGLALTAAPDRRRTQLRASAVAWAFFVPFALSTWNPHPRYFAPAWAAVLAVLSVQAATRAWRRPLAFGVLVVALLLSVWQVQLLKQLRTAGVSVTEGLFMDVNTMRAEEAWVAGQGKDCVLRLSSGYAWDRPIDFIGVGLSREDGEKIIADHGGKPCLPPKAPR